MIVEIFAFRLRPDVTEARFLEVDARVQTDFYYQQPGLVRRTTAKGPDGNWVSVTFWIARENVVEPDEAFTSLVTDVRSQRFESLD